MIRRLRRLFGLGSDSMDGVHEVTVLECGAKLEVFERIFTRSGSVYENTTDIEGTLHQIQLEVDSEKAMTGRFKFSIGDQTDRIPLAEAAKLEAAGVSIDSLRNIHVESDAPMRWTYAGSSEQEAEARRKQAACECKEVFKAALLWRVMVEAWGDADLRSTARADQWDAERFESELFKKYDVVFDFVAPLIEGGQANATYGAMKRFWRTQTSGGGNARSAMLGVAHDDPSEVLVLDREAFDAKPPAVQKAGLIHETVHQAQLRGRQVRAGAEADAEEQSDEPAIGDADWIYSNIMSDLWDKGLRESDAYGAGLDHLLEWMDENCNDCDGCEHWGPGQIPNRNRSLLQEARDSIGGGEDTVISADDPMA